MIMGCRLRRESLVRLVFIFYFWIKSKVGIISVEDLGYSCGKKLCQSCICTFLTIITIDASFICYYPLGCFVLA